jgi:hypothetical protein
VGQLTECGQSIRRLTCFNHLGLASKAQRATSTHYGMRLEQRSIEEPDTGQWR